MKDFVAIDFETANGSRDSICSVGLVIVENEVITQKIYSLIKPIPNEYTYWNTKVHGMTARDTEYSLPFFEIWPEILKQLKGLPFVAHNSVFDAGCLRAIHQTNQQLYPEYDFLCTLKAAKKQLPQLENHKLNTVAKHCGFNLTNHHHALADAEACAAIAIQLL